MANLTPERRADKNGKFVIRHVLTHGDNPAPKSMPAPLSSAEALLIRFQDTLPQWGNIANKIPGLRAISQSNPDLFNGIMQSYFDSGDMEREVWQLAISRYDADRVVKEEYFQRIIKLVPLSDTLFRDGPSGFRLGKLTKSAEVAERYTAISPLDDDYAQVQAWVILREIEGLNVSDSQSRIQDQKFIAKNMEVILPLLPEIRERRDASEAFINELLHNRAPAMRNGVL